MARDGSRFIHKCQFSINPWAKSIQPKFPGWGSKIFWGQMDRDGSGRSRSTPFSKISKGVSRSFKMEDVGSLLLVLELGWQSRLYQWYCANCFMRRNLTPDYFEQSVPRYVPVEFNDFQTPFSNNEMLLLHMDVRVTPMESNTQRGTGIKKGSKRSNRTVNIDRTGPTE